MILESAQSQVWVGCCEFLYTTVKYTIFIRYKFSIPLSEGDLWYFPAGNPHSVRAKEAAKDSQPDGAEFLLIFDKGTISEDATFQL